MIETSIKLPDITAMLINLPQDTKRDCLEVSILIQVTKKNSNEFKKKFADLVALNDYAKGTSFLRVSGAISPNLPLIIELQGSLNKVQVLLSGITDAIGSSKTTFKVVERDNDHRQLECAFFISDQQGWSHPVVFSVAWLKSSTKETKANPVESKMATQWTPFRKRNINKVIGGLEEGRTLNFLKSAHELKSATIPSLSLEKDSESINGSREWQIYLSNTNYDHNYDNVRFNCLLNPFQPENLNLANPANVEGQKTNKNDSESSHQSGVNKQEDETKGNKKNQTQEKKDEKLLLNNYIVKIEGVEWSKFTHREFSNLFTTYGNISLSLKFEKEKVAYMIYGSQAAVDNALVYLDGIFVCASRLTVTKVRKETVLLMMADLEYSSCFPKKRYSTSGSGLPNQVNPISRTLHVTFHRDSRSKVLTDAELLSVMSQFCTPARIKRETSKRNKNMWFVEYNNKEDACMVTMKQHNKTFKGGILRVSFTKTIESLY